MKLDTILVFFCGALLVWGMITIWDKSKDVEEELILDKPRETLGVRG